MALLFKNDAKSSLAGPITNTSTTANLASGTGVLFPNPSAPDYFKLTFMDAATGLIKEIVHVTGVSGDTITMVRAQEGTTAQNWNAGDKCGNLWTAGSAAAMLQSQQVSQFYQGLDTATDPNAMAVPTVVPSLSAPPVANTLYLVTKGSNPNTGAVTLLVGTGPTAGTRQSVVYANGAQLRSGDWPGTAAAWLYYTGGVWQFMGLLSPRDDAEWHNGTASGGSSTLITTTLTPAPQAPLVAGTKIMVPISTTNGNAPNLQFLLADGTTATPPIVDNVTGLPLAGGELRGSASPRYHAFFVIDISGNARLINPVPAASIPGNTITLISPNQGPLSQAFHPVLLSSPGTLPPWMTLASNTITITQNGNYSIYFTGEVFVSASAGVNSVDMDLELYISGLAYPIHSQLGYATNSAGWTTTVSYIGWLAAGTTINLSVLGSANSGGTFASNNNQVVLSKLG